MIVYHGSERIFKQLKISPSLTRSRSTFTNEGPGIYFSTDRRVAEDYGRWIYVLDINDKAFVDYRNKSNCMRYVFGIRNELLEKTGIDIGKMWNIAETADRMYLGGLAVTGVGREIALMLDSFEEWHRLSKTKRETILRILRRYDKSQKVYMFNGCIKDCGVIKDVSDNVVRILRREER